MCVNVCSISQRTIARQRWHQLSSAITRSSNTHHISSSYGLVELTPIDNDWQLASIDDCQLIIHRHANEHDLDHLVGFNNTGNVRLWPSEEILAHYLVHNRSIIANKRVVELGAGMTGLAGFVASYSAASVLLTDGNRRSIDNLRTIVDRNRRTNVSICELDWRETHERLSSASADVIICADCLFFDDSRLALLDTIVHLLAVDGVAYMIAPNRGGTFASFRALVEREQRRRFDVCVSNDYDRVTSARRDRLMCDDARFDYDRDYPLLMIVRSIM